MKFDFFIKMENFLAKCNVTKRRTLLFSLSALSLSFCCLGTSTLPSNLPASVVKIAEDSPYSDVMVEAYCKVNNEEWEDWWYHPYQYPYENVLKLAFDGNWQTYVGGIVYRQYYIDEISNDKKGTFSYSSTCVFPGTKFQRSVRAISADIGNWDDLSSQKVDSYFGATYLYRDTSLPVGNGVVLSYQMATDYLNLVGNTGDDLKSILGKSIDFYEWRSNSGTSSPDPLTIVGILNPVNQMSSIRINVTESDFCFLSRQRELFDCPTVVQKLVSTSAVKEKTISYMVENLTIPHNHSLLETRLRLFSYEQGSRVPIESENVSSIWDAKDNYSLASVCVVWFLLFSALFFILAIIGFRWFKSGSRHLAGYAFNSWVIKCGIVFCKMTLFYFVVYGFIRLFGALGNLIIKAPIFYFGTASSVIGLGAIFLFTGFLVINEVLVSRKSDPK